jgi:hypothetical protein
MFKNDENELKFIFIEEGGGGVVVGSTLGRTLGDDGKAISKIFGGNEKRCQGCQVGWGMPRCCKD